MTDNNDEDYRKGNVDTRLKNHERRINSNEGDIDELQDDVDTNASQIAVTRRSVRSNDGDIDALENHLRRIETAFDDRLSNQEKFSMYVKGGLAVLTAVVGFGITIGVAFIPQFF